MTDDEKRLFEAMAEEAVADRARIGVLEARTVITADEQRTLRAECNGYAQQAGALRRERDEARSKLDDLAERFKALESDLAARKRELAAVKAPAESVWFWQGQCDHIASLICPVVMEADTLRALVDAQRQRDEARTIIECYHASRPFWPLHLREAISRGDVEAVKAEASRAEKVVEGWLNDSHALGEARAARDTLADELAAVRKFADAECAARMQAQAELATLRCDLDLHKAALAEAQRVRDDCAAETLRLRAAMTDLSRVANRVALTVPASANAHADELARAVGASITILAPPASLEAPCGGSRCHRADDGTWIHSSKSYGTCSMRDEPPPESAPCPANADGGHRVWNADGPCAFCKCGRVLT